MPPPLTVLIPCKDEERNIGLCLESVRPIADELLVADSGSTDRTLEIARSFDARIIEREYITSGDFKNWAIPQARHGWVLLLDADERATPELLTEIRETLSDPEQDGYRIYRKNFLFGKPAPRGALAHDNALRLFRRDLAHYEGPSDHGDVVIDTGRVGFLRSRLLHYSFWTWQEYDRKIERYVSLQAQQWLEAGKRASFVQMLFRPPCRFVRDYLLKLGFLDGSVGLQLAVAGAYYCFLKQARLWALTHSPDRERCEAELRRLLAAADSRASSAPASGRRVA